MGNHCGAGALNYLCEMNRSSPEEGDRHLILLENG